MNETDHGRTRRLLVRSRAVVSIALAQLRHAPLRTAFTTVAIALAVLSVTLFASAGIGVHETGREKFDDADRDLWIAGGGVELSLDGTLENPIVASHDVAETARDHEGVESAAPIAFQTVYVDAGDGDPEPITAVGVPETHRDLAFEAGEGFSHTAGRPANGSDGEPGPDEVVVDRRTADSFDVGVGDRVAVSPDRRSDGRSATVVGIADAYSQFLGMPTVTVPLSELQALTGTAGSDRATFVTITLEDDADVADVRSDLEAAYPEYEVRTNDDQFETMLESQALVFASATTIVALAVLVGAALTVNILVVSVTRRSSALSALHRMGISRGTIVAVVVARSALLGAAGGAVGLAATPPLAGAVDGLVADLVGFPDLLRVTASVYALGAGVAATICLLGATIVGWYLAATL